jgi:hypothetical protein
MMLSSTGGMNAKGENYSFSDGGYVISIAPCTI